MASPRRGSKSSVTYNRTISPVPQPSDLLLSNEVLSSTISVLSESTGHRTSSEADATVEGVNIEDGNNADERIQCGLSRPVIDSGARESNSSTDEQHTTLPHIHQNFSNVTPKGVSISTTAERAIWSPFWLQKLWLVAFAAGFATLAGVIIALYFTSARLDGLGASTGTKGMSYFWKFLPTAILVAILALWHPVDYFTRLLQPWSNLAKGPAPATRTLFLDHVSRWQPVILYSAIMNFDWPVVLTTAISWSLLAARIFSTGLLMVESTPVSVDNITLTRTALFDSSQWNGSLLFSDVATLYSGIHREGLPQPPWTRPDLVAEPFTLQGDTILIPRNVTYRTKTKALFPKLYCEEAKLAQDPSYSAIQANATLRSDTCEVETVLYLADSTQAFRLQNKWPYENYVGNVQNIQCSNQTRYLATVTQANENLRITRYSALICRPDYQIKDIMIRIGETGEQKFEMLPASRSNDLQLRGLDANKVFDALIKPSTTGSLPWIEPSGNVTEANNQFLTLVAIPFTRGKPGALFLKPLLDPNTFNTSMADAFTGMFSLLVAQNMLRPQEDPIQGQIQYPEDRLHVKRLPAAIVAALCLLCSLLTVALILIRPVSVVPKDPSSIGALATIVGPIQDLELLGRLNFEEVVRSLRIYDFCSNTSPMAGQGVAESGFDISMESSARPQTAKENKKHHKKLSQPTKWSPLALKKPVKALAILLCLLTIVALEVLQRLSDHLDGFVEVPSSDNSQFWASSIAGLYMTCVGLLLSSIYFNYCLLAPYQPLTSAIGAKANQSILTNYLGNIPLLTIVRAIPRKHHSVSIAAIAAFLGGFLTIIVSALHSVELIHINKGLEVMRLDGFNESWSLGTGDSSASHVIQFITWGNLTEPQWTYEDLALPEVSLPITPSIAGEEKISLTLPVRRAVLECSVKGATDIIARKDSETYDGKTYQNSTKIYTTVNNSCVQSPGMKLPVMASSFVSGYAPYGGTIQQLLFLGNGTSAQITEQINNKFPISNSGQLDLCPSLSFLFGSLPDTYTRVPQNSTTPRQNLSSADTQLTHLTCAQRIQELDATVTLLLPNLTIDRTNPPNPDEASKRYVGSVHQFPVVPHLQSFGILPSKSNRSDIDINELGRFFAAIIHGKDGISAAELVGEANSSRLTAAVSKMYGRYMAQVMSRKMRVPHLNTSPPQTLQASLTQRLPRIVQHSAPKLALQILLGVMMLCGILSWILMPNARILPHDPCSIAGSACLLAGKEFWGHGKKEWEENQRFKLDTRDGKFGIYAVGTESRRLVSR